MLVFNKTTLLFEEVDEIDSSTSQVVKPDVPLNRNANRDSIAFMCSNVILGIAFFFVSWFCVVCICLITGFYVTTFNRLIISGVLAFAVTIIMRITSRHLDFLSL